MLARRVNNITFIYAMTLWIIIIYSRFEEDTSKFSKPLTNDTTNTC